MKIFFVVTFLSLLSCQSKKETKLDSGKLLPGNNSSSMLATEKISSFLDSILNRNQISIEQVREHTVVDSFYFTGRYSTATFTGDTVFGLRNGFLGAILDYDDRLNCSYQFLLVFRSTGLQNTSYKKISSDCDRDESADYTRLDYQLLSDSCFETTESFIPANSDTISRAEKLNWKISERGLILPIQ